MTHRWPRRALLWAGLAIGAILVAAFVDHAVTYDSLPADLGFSPGNPGSFDEVQDAQDAYSTRAWLYSLGVVAVVVALLVVALRSAAPEDRRDLFRDLGVAAVLFLFVGFLISAQEPYLTSANSTDGLFYLPAILMLVTAAAGGIASRDTADEPFDAGTWLASIPPIALAGLGLTALTVILVLIAQPGSDCGGDASDRSEPVLIMALVTGGAAGICGLVSLFKRRWLAALVSIAAPVVAFAALLIAACLS